MLPQLLVLLSSPLFPASKTLYVNPCLIDLRNFLASLFQNTPLILSQSQHSSIIFISQLIEFKRNGKVSHVLNIELMNASQYKIKGVFWNNDAKKFLKSIKQGLTYSVFDAGNRGELSSTSSCGNNIKKQYTDRLTIYQ